jgi:lipopolysaccharide/colanic/teichoic acid biosynthesis glycosyltransferase
LEHRYARTFGSTDDIFGHNASVAMAVLSGSSDGQLGGIGFGDAGTTYVVDCFGAQSPRTYQSVKRSVDLVVALMLLVMLAPILLAIAVAVMLDSDGPILFRQRRVGQFGRTFYMLKFRTMRRERRTRSEGPPGAVERRRRHKSVADPRVTRTGRILRRTCVDELPQLWNVVRGEMSLVGPRPEMPNIVECYEPWQHGRHLVAPGITGWWQVNRTADRLMHEATELDIYYVQHLSPSLDLRIIARTLGAVIEGRGAY